MAFDQAKADAVLAAIADGHSTREACEIAEQNRGEFYVWLSQDPKLADQYARAKDACAELLADEIVDIAEDGRNDWVERENARTGETYIALNREAIERSRLRIDARKWVASKLLPKRYGDRIQQDVDATIRVEIADPAQLLRK